LSDVARQRYPGAEVRYRRSYLAPKGTHEQEGTAPVRVCLPPGGTRSNVILASAL
jgi:hypothetical protein